MATAQKRSRPVNPNVSQLKESLTQMVDETTGQTTSPVDRGPVMPGREDVARKEMHDPAETMAESVRIEDRTDTASKQNIAEQAPRKHAGGRPRNAVTPTKMVIYLSPENAKAVKHTAVDYGTQYSKVIDALVSQFIDKVQL